MPGEINPGIPEEPGIVPGGEKPFTPGGGKKFEVAKKPTGAEGAIQKVGEGALNKFAPGVNSVLSNTPGVGKLWDQAKNQAAKMAKKLAWNSIKAFVIANWPTILTVVIVLILLVMILVPAFGGIAKARRGGYGRTPVTGIAFASSADRTLINEFSMLANGGSALDPIKVRDLAQKILDKLNSGELVFSKKTEAITALTQIITLSQQASTGYDAGKISQITSLILSVLADYNSNPVGLGALGDYFSPIGDQPVLAFNSSLHGRSVMHPAPVGNHLDKHGLPTGHNVFHGFSNPGVGDAVDLGIASSEGSNKQVFAMFDGDVTTNGNSGALECAILKGTKGVHQLEAWYCHVHDVVPGHYSMRSPIAKIGAYKHVHFEIWVDGKSIHTTPEDVAKGGEMGKYMWQHIKDAFGF